MTCWSHLVLEKFSYENDKHIHATGFDIQSSMSFCNYKNRILTRLTEYKCRAADTTRYWCCWVINVATRINVDSICTLKHLLGRKNWRGLALSFHIWNNHIINFYSRQCFLLDELEDNLHEEQKGLV